MMNNKYKCLIRMYTQLNSITQSIIIIINKYLTLVCLMIYKENRYNPSIKCPRG